MRVLLMLGLLTGLAHALPAVALVADLEGRVEVRTAPQAAWSAAWLDQRLQLQNGIRTWKQSNAELRFVDGSVLMLSQQTRLEISTALFDPSAAPPEIRVALKSGGVDVRAGRTPLVVTASNGATHRFSPGARAHVRVVGDGERASLIVGQPRMLAGVDVEPLVTLTPPTGAEADAPPSSGGRRFESIPRLVGELPMVPIDTIAVVQPPTPDPVPMIPEAEPDPEAPPGPPQVRVQIEVRAGGD